MPRARATRGIRRLLPSQRRRALRRKSQAPQTTDTTMMPRHHATASQAESPSGVPVSRARIVSVTGVIVYLMLYQM